MDTLPEEYNYNFGFEMEGLESDRVMVEKFVVITNTFVLLNLLNRDDQPLLHCVALWDGVEDHRDELTCRQEVGLSSYVDIWEYAEHRRQKLKLIFSY